MLNYAALVPAIFRPHHRTAKAFTIAVKEEAESMDILTARAWFHLFVFGLVGTLFFLIGATHGHFFRGALGVAPFYSFIAVCLWLRSKRKY